MHPVLFKIGPLAIYSYGIMVALGFIVAIYLAKQRAKEDGIDPDRVIDLGVYTLISGVIGSRLLYVLLNIREYLASPLEILMLHHGGMVFYGGLILAVAAGTLFLRKRQIPIFEMGDTIIPYVALGQAIGRIGCLLNGCCYGKVTNLPWGIYLPGHPLPLHPTQVYFSLNSLALFLILGFIREKKVYTGQIFLSYFLLYTLTRFFIEFLRGDTLTVVFGKFSVSQLISVIILVISLAIFIKKRISLS